MPTFDEIWIKSGDVGSADARAFYEGGYDEAQAISEVMLKAADELAHRVRVRMNIRGKDNERLMYEIERATERYEALRK